MITKYVVKDFATQIRICLYNPVGQPSDLDRDNLDGLRFHIRCTVPYLDQTTSVFVHDQQALVTVPKIGWSLSIVKEKVKKRKARGEKVSRQTRRMKREHLYYSTMYQISVISFWRRISILGKKEGVRSFEKRLSRCVNNKQKR